MINVCFAGITGWTAPPITDAIETAGELALTAVRGVRRGLDSLLLAGS
jgi:4-hydroxy-tetrahydrodipicolinate reductase